MKVAGPPMATRTATDKKAAHRIFRSQMRLHNQIVKEVDKTIMNLKRAKELKHRNSILANLIQVMREQGASDQSIRKALPGLEEFTKFADKKMSSSASDQQEHPHPV